MKRIDTDKLSREMADTLIHMDCVKRSGQYLASYLIHNNRSIDAIRLLGKCAVHDVSKIQNTQEFMALASIIDDIHQMADAEHVQSKEQVEAKQLHWANNSHHPEHYENPNDMSELDLLEMACDCHARSKQFGSDLIEYIDCQQNIRFNFDDDHLKRLKTYCVALTELTKFDDYSDILKSDLKFDLKDSTMELLENFDDECYLDCLKTDRLYLKKEHNPDFASVVYSINLKEDNTEIGYISLKCHGYLEYKIFENYVANGYALESLAKIIDICTMPEIFIIVKKNNEIAKNIVERLGFKPIEEFEHTINYRYRKPTKLLEKVIN